MSTPVVLLPPLASTSREQLQYSFHSRVMVAATLILCIVVFFVVSLHVYAKWFWRRGGAGAASSAPGDDALWRLHRRHLPAEFVDVRSTPAPPISLGLDPSTIDLLPTFIHHPSSPRKQPDDAAPLLECAVCLSEFQSLEKGRILPDCKHRFHIGCIDVWLRSHSTCPLCRLPVSPWIPHHFEQSACAQPTNSPSQFAPTSFLLLPVTAHREGERATALSGLQSASSIVGYGCPIERPSTTIAIAIPGNPESLVHGHHFSPIHSQPEAQASWEHMSNSSCESSRSTKSTSDFPLQGNSGASIARCQSLGVPGRPSEDTESCGLQPVKSRSFHKPIKWLISRDLSRGKGRIFPSASSGEGAEEQGQQLEQSSSRSTGLPV